MTLIVHLWLRGDDVRAFEEFEREAAAIMASHGGRVERAFRTLHLQQDEPFEIHLVVFRDEEAFEAYRSDARTLSLSERREQIIARTEIWRGDEVMYD